MLERILPRHLDNTYRGHTLAIWLFVPVVAMKMLIAIGTIFNGRGAAQSADGIPLDTFDAAGAEAVVALFALWGLCQLVLGTLGVLALARYRAMIPLMFTLLLLEQLARKGILLVKPIATTGASPGFYINLGLAVLLMTGLALSLRNRPDPDRPS